MPGENKRSLTEDPRYETAAFGREIELFLEEDRIGHYLVERARSDLAVAQEALVDIDPADARAIAALQLDARVANRVRQWLGEAIQAGQQAQQLLEEDRRG